MRKTPCSARWRLIDLGEFISALNGLATHVYLSLRTPHRAHQSHPCSIPDLPISGKASCTLVSSTVSICRRRGEAARQLGRALQQVSYHGELQLESISVIRKGKFLWRPYGGASGLFTCSRTQQQSSMAQRSGSTAIKEEDVHVTSVLTKRNEHAILEANANIDDATLGALGYKQEFKRCSNRTERSMCGTDLRAETSPSSNPSRSPSPC